MHVIFDVNSVQYENFFNNQYGAGAGPYFEGLQWQRGYRLQRGRGLGNVLASIWRFISPALLDAAKTAGRETLATGSRILSDVADGNTLKQSFKTQAETGAKNLLKKASDKYLQTGSGKRKRRKPVGRLFTKHGRRDVFGPY